MTSRTLTILLADLKGFTPRTAASSRKELTELLGNYRKIITPVVERCGGHIIKEIGDAFLVTFESPTNAVTAGTVLQQLLRERNRVVPEERRIEVRVAIHSGEVEDAGGDVIGDAVNVVSRVEAVTEVGEVYFTEPVFLTMNRNEVPSCEVGQRVLKGLAEPVKLYRVLQDSADERYRKLLAAAPEVAPALAGARRRLLVPAVVLAALAAAAITFFVVRSGDPEIAAARELVENGRGAEAVEALGRAFEKRVPDAEVLDLVERAADEAIAARIGTGDFDVARDLAYKWSGRWPSLAGLPVRVALAESEHFLAAGQPRAALDAILAAREKKVEDWRLSLALSRLYSDVKLPVNPRESIRSGIYMESVAEVADAVRLYPRGELLPAELKEQVWKKFSVQPRQAGTVLEPYALTLYDLVGEHLWPEYKDKLIAGCASFQEDELRLNCFEVLEKKGALDGVDFVTYHGGNLCYRRWSKKQTEALAYLLALTDAESRGRALEVMRRARERLMVSSRSDDKKMLEKVEAAMAKMEAGE